MRILLVTTAFPRWVGDHRAPFIWEAAKAVSACGNMVKIIAMHVPGSKTKEIWDGIEIFRPRYLPDRLDIIQKDRAGIPSFWRLHPFLRFLLVPFAIVHILAVIQNARGCDLIHANWTLSGLAVWVGKWMHHKDFIVTVHGSDAFQAGKNPLIRWVSKRMLLKARRVIAVSARLKEELNSWGIPSSRVVVIPDGVRIDIFQPHQEERKKVILYVGSITELKGIPILLEAFAQFFADHPIYRLNLIGDGPLVKPLQERLKKLGINQSVNFLGSLPHEQVRDWMQKAKLLVLPSLSEGLGVVLLEAMACGTPCIGSQVGGIPDILNPEVGFLVPPGSAEAITVAMHRILLDEALWLKMSQKARQRIEEGFSWQKVGNAIDQVYRSAI